MESFKGNLSSVGLDPGLKETVTGSAGETLNSSKLYRKEEYRIAQLQRTGHKRQVKRIHLAIKNRRRDAHNKFAKEILDTYQFVFIGDASSRKLDKTHHEDTRIKKSSITMLITLKKLIKILPDLAALGAAYAILGFYLAILIHVMLYL